ncbi:Set1 complex component spp1 [Paramyrothecium foliicola]|nr:Set1 complex component spp1 [Paramyrothecium foliicola]
MDQSRMATSMDGQPQPEVIDDNIKSESMANSPQLPAMEPAPATTQSPHHPHLTTESSDTNSMAGTTGLKKKGTASAIKKGPKRPNGGETKRPKKLRTETTNLASDDISEEEESDNGPYCICRGPDDHRWMICCETCEDWFHGACIDLDKSIGESLIEKFVCPNCTNEDLTTIYKKTCALGSCRKPARLTQSPSSVFCSNEHAQMWWERLLSRLPKGKRTAGLSDQLSQDEFMALLNSGLAGVDEQGMWRISKTPFAGEIPAEEDETKKDGESSPIFSDEEREFLEGTAQVRFQLAEETLLCHKMLTLIELAQERRRSAINAGRLGEDICGYDQRLDTVSARDAFAAFAKSPESDDIFHSSKLGDPLGEGDEVRGMCERKRCKVHSGWQKLLALGIKHQIREMAGQAAEVEEEERMLKEAATERCRRKKAETNWVEVLE